MNRLLEVGQKMGLDEKELQSFVSEQFVLGRDERQRDCNFKRAQMEVERVLRERAYEREREREESRRKHEYDLKRL